jgi:hypothetical protein
VRRRFVLSASRANIAWLRTYFSSSPGRRSWLFRGKLNGREVWRGLGSDRIVPLREARAAALTMRLEIHNGSLPGRRLRPQAVPTFTEVAEEYIITHEKGWRDHRAAQTWHNTLQQHASKLAKLPVDAIDGSTVAVGDQGRVDLLTKHSPQGSRTN